MSWSDILAVASRLPQSETQTVYRSVFTAESAAERERLRAKDDTYDTIPLFFAPRQSQRVSNDRTEQADKPSVMACFNAAARELALGRVLAARGNTAYLNEVLTAVREAASPESISDSSPAGTLTFAAFTNIIRSLPLPTLDHAAMEASKAPSTRAAKPAPSISSPSSPTAAEVAALSPVSRAALSPYSPGSAAGTPTAVDPHGAAPSPTARQPPRRSSSFVPVRVPLTPSLRASSVPTLRRSTAPPPQPQSTAPPQLGASTSAPLAAARSPAAQAAASPQTATAPPLGAAPPGLTRTRSGTVALRGAAWDVASIHDLLTPSMFVGLPHGADGTVDVLDVMRCVVRRYAATSFHVAVLAADAKGSGELDRSDLAALWGALVAAAHPQYDAREAAFLVDVSVRRTLMMLDPTGRGRVSCEALARSVLAVDAGDALVAGAATAVGIDTSTNPLCDERAHALYLFCDTTARSAFGNVTVSDLSGMEDGFLLTTFVKRALELLVRSPTRDSRRDVILDLALYIEYRGALSSVGFYMNVLDKEGRGYLTPLDLRPFVADLYRRTRRPVTAKYIGLFVAEMFELVGCDETLRITRKDLMACQCRDIFFGLISDVRVLQSYEDRDNVMQALQQDATRPAGMTTPGKLPMVQPGVLSGALVAPIVDATGGTVGADDMSRRGFGRPMATAALCR